MVAATLELVGERATRKAGEILGELLGEQPIGKTAFALALEGELGAGKTTFIRGLAKGLGIRDKITSPSFLIAKCYRFSSLRGAQRRSGAKRHPEAKPKDPFLYTTEIPHFVRDDTSCRIASLRDAQRPFARPVESRRDLYGARNDGEGRAFWHFDFYRLQRPTRRDLDLLHFLDILRDPRNIVAIEWAEKVVGFLPREKLTLRLNVVSPTRRHIAMGNAQCLISH